MQLLETEDGSPSRRRAVGIICERIIFAKRDCMVWIELQTPHTHDCLSVGDTEIGVSTQTMAELG